MKNKGLIEISKDDQQKVPVDLKSISSNGVALPITSDALEASGVSNFLGYSNYEGPPLSTLPGTKMIFVKCDENYQITQTTDETDEFVIPVAIYVPESIGNSDRMRFLFMIHGSELHRWDTARRYSKRDWIQHYCNLHDRIVIAPVFTYQCAHQQVPYDGTGWYSEIWNRIRSNDTNSMNDPLYKYRLFEAISDIRENLSNSSLILLVQFNNWVATWYREPINFMDNMTSIYKCAHRIDWFIQALYYHMKANVFHGLINDRGTIDLVGWSMGGQLACKLFFFMPDFLSSLTIGAPGEALYPTFFDDEAANEREYQTILRPHGYPCIWDQNQNFRFTRTTDFSSVTNNDVARYGVAALDLRRMTLTDVDHRIEKMATIKTRLLVGLDDDDQFKPHRNRYWQGPNHILLLKKYEIVFREKVRRVMGVSVESSMNLKLHEVKGAGHDSWACLKDLWREEGYLAPFGYIDV